MLPFEGGDLHGAPQHRARCRDLGNGHQIPPVALEPLVLGDHDLHVQIACRRPGFAGVPGPGDPDALPRLDPGWHVELPGTRPGDAARAVALGTRRLRDLSLSGACRACAAANHLAEDASAHLANLAESP